MQWRYAGPGAPASGRGACLAICRLVLCARMAETQGTPGRPSWPALAHSHASLSDGDNEFAKIHEEFKGVFPTFQKDADQIFRDGKHLLAVYIMKPKVGYDDLASAAHFAAKSSIGTNVCTTGGSLSDGDNELAKIHEEVKGVYPTFQKDADQIFRDGKHLRAAYTMKSKAGYDDLATAAQIAAKSPIGTNVSTTDDLIKTVDALGYYTEQEAEEKKTAYPAAHCDRSITDGRAMMCSVLTLSIVTNQGTGNVKYGKIYGNIERSAQVHLNRLRAQSMDSFSALGWRAH